MISSGLQRKSMAVMPSKLGIVGETYSLITKSSTPHFISALWSSNISGNYFPHTLSNQVVKRGRSLKPVLHSTVNAFAGGAPPALNTHGQLTDHLHCNSLSKVTGIHTESCSLLQTKATCTFHPGN